MIIGFTGTRDGMTPFQAEQLRAELWLIAQQSGQHQFHHGCCIGADEQAAAIARALGFWIVGHPPLNRSQMSKFINDENRAPREYLSRNRAIVLETERMFATTKEMNDRLRSGTWSTIRFARKASKQLMILFPE